VAKGHGKTVKETSMISKVKRKTEVSCVPAYPGADLFLRTEFGGIGPGAESL